MKMNDQAFDAVRCWAKGSIVCQNKVQPVHQLLAFIDRELPQDATFFSPAYGLAIRAFVKRPLAFAWKDMGWLAYSNRSKLAESASSLQRYQTIKMLESNSDSESLWVDFGRQQGADFVVTSLAPKTETLSPGDEILFSNKAGVIIKVAPDIPPQTNESTR